MERIAENERRRNDAKKRMMGEADRKEAEKAEKD
jgi:hypothetical protein